MNNSETKNTRATMSSSRLVHTRSAYSHNEYSLSLLIKLSKIIILVSKFQATYGLNSNIRLCSSAKTSIIHYIEVFPKDIIAAPGLRA